MMAAKRTARIAEPVATTGGLSPVAEHQPPDVGLVGLPDKPTYLVSEVAYFFGCAQQTVRLWLAHGKLEAVSTPGGQRRVTRESLRRCALMQNRRVSA